MTVIPDWKLPTPKEKQLDDALLSKAKGVLHDLLVRLLAE